MPLALPSLAKINLFLHVPAKRPDGFHEVRTLMLPIGLADELTFDLLDEPRIDLTCSEPSLPTDKRNLVFRAATLLQSRHATTRGARIHLKKNAPIGAGLGAGSSNGSVTLTGLNRLWNLNLADSVLETLAGEFGSDTAFFVRCQPALSEGRGEILTPVDFPHRLPIFLMNFGFGSATAWAYKNYRVQPDPHPLSSQEYVRQAIAVWERSDPSAVAGVLRNDLERPVFEKFPVLHLGREFLLAQPQVLGAMMCGSGSTLMAILRSAGQGPALETAVRREFGPKIWTWLGSTQN
ncbi:MAG: 4-(cytidine 5'-diphospho)-2-C-methyl-D-erythritol kinase [Verrucomicrobiae bacterium]|nr:4-(cytidine 5'-diphospho)-2-C-methyl-D-erythritol kinase [Verrucomicrobiae bacterium]